MLELTKEQIKTLENVFNWALNGLDEEFSSGMIIRANEKGEFEAVNEKTEEKKITDLFNVIKKHVCLKKPAKDRLDVSYIIKAKSGKDTLYYDAINGEWTTITHCTKFYLKSDAMKEKKKIESDWICNVKVAKCKTEEI